MELWEGLRETSKAKVPVEAGRARPAQTAAGRSTQAAPMHSIHSICGQLAPRESRIPNWQLQAAE
jgi:hypothetical protein